METRNKRLGIFRPATWVFAALAVTSMSLLPSEISAQTNVTTSGGTINKIPKWSPTTTSLSDSVITESGGNVGIGEEKDDENH